MRPRTLPCQGEGGGRQFLFRCMERARGWDFDHRPAVHAEVSLVDLSRSTVAEIPIEPIARKQIPPAITDCAMASSKDCAGTVNET